jgi:hypothetical protein
VAAGETLAVLHGASEGLLGEVRPRVSGAFRIEDSAPAAAPLVMGRLCAEPPGEAPGRG